MCLAVWSHKYPRLEVAVKKVVLEIIWVTSIILLILKEPKNKLHLFAYNPLFDIVKNPNKGFKLK